jgi:hypothetical protein
MANDIANPNPMGEPSEMDLRRTTQFIEEVCPNLDMTPPYGELAINALARTMGLLRDPEIRSHIETENELTGRSKTYGLFRQCFDQARAQMNLSADDELVRLMQVNAAAISGLLIDKEVFEFHG